MAILGTPASREIISFACDHKHYNDRLRVNPLKSVKVFKLVLDATTMQFPNSWWTLVDVGGRALVSLRYLPRL